MNQTPKNRRNIENTMLNRTLTMFHYEGLPKFLPERELEKILQINGYGIVLNEAGYNYIPVQRLVNQMLKQEVKNEPNTEKPT